MLTTTAIQAALFATLQASGLVEHLLCHSDSDLEATLSHLRDFPTTLAVIVPGETTISYHFEDEDIAPVRVELRDSFEILVSGRSLDMRQTGDPATLTLKDQLLGLLLCADLAQPGIICLPSAAVPLSIQFEDGHGREAWKISLTTRQIL